ncbi:unnamed protein product [Rhodiola kirilowii]
MPETLNPTFEIVPEKPPNPFISLLQNFRLPFPLPGAPRSNSEKSREEDTSDKTADVVRFSDPIPAVPPPLKIESEESTQSAAVVWQVYALGGYLLARWIWGKWKEKHNKDQPSDENTPPPQ